MNCWLYEILKTQFEGFPAWIRFLEINEKHIVFDSMDGMRLCFRIDDVPLTIFETKIIKRIVNIGIPGAA